MKKVNNKYIFLLGLILGLIFSITSVYAIDAYIESNKVSYDNHEGKITKKDNVQDSIDELYERSGIHKEKWIDPVLNGADPVLQEPLIPIEIKSNGDVYYANENSEWYNYSEKRWANAVILNDNAISKYTTGMQIQEKDIQGYFVWIPRYQYKIWDLGKYTTAIILKNLLNEQNTAAETALLQITGNNTRIIDIKFGSADNIPKMAESEAKLNEYYTHPAFTLGNKELNGIWVGKFETGGTSADTMVIKPNEISWRNETVKTFFDAGYNYKRELDSHMMKNTEWGAVAYLSHSQYGIGNEVNINNANDYMTGYSAAPNTNQGTSPGESAEHTDSTKTQPWNTSTGYLASTTGNISGIYDMGGGSFEYMAACMDNIPGSSEFSTDELNKYMKDGYIDKYSSDSNNTSWDKRILGDATGEMGPFYSYLESSEETRYSSWYTSVAIFIGSTNSWFHRGGFYNDGTLAGQFNFINFSGGVADTIGYRLVLSPTN